MWTYLSDQCMGAISKSKGAGCFLLKIVARVEIHLCMQAVFIVDCASPQENPWHPFIYSHVIVNGKWRSLILVCWPFFSMKVDCPFNPFVAILILYASPIPLLCGCLNPHQRWTMHLSLMDMMAASSFFFFHSKAVWHSYPCQNGGCYWCIYGTPMVMTCAIFRTRIWSALMFLPKVHGWYSPYVVKVLETSMVCTLYGAWSSQIGLYVHWIVARGGYGLATEWSLHPCVLPCLSLPLEDAAYSLWISGVHGSLEDIMEILWKLGCGPLKSCNRGNACAWTGCLQLIVRSKWQKKKAYTCLLLLPVEMTADSLAFSLENPSHCWSDQPV